MFSFDELCLGNVASLDSIMWCYYFNADAFVVRLKPFDFIMDILDLRKHYVINKMFDFVLQWMLYKVTYDDDLILFFFVSYQVTLT